MDTVIRLSDRLKVMADLVNKGETVADIGTDHGFLPMYLVEANISPRTVLADVSRASLEKAISNVSRRNYDEVFEQRFDFRWGSGLEVLENSEVDCITIAGMGGILITEILGENLDKTGSFRKFILQPRNAQGELRYWLRRNGFGIKSEILVKEGKYICEVILAEVSKKIANSDSKNWLAEFENLGYESIEYEIPESKLIKNRYLYREFIKRKINKEEDILKKLEKASGNMDEIKQQREKRIEYLSTLL